MGCLSTEGQPFFVRVRTLLSLTTIRLRFARMSRSSTLGFLFGSAAGLAAGLLLAPEEGQKLRRRVVYQLERLGDRATRLSELMQRSDADVDATARGTGQAVVRNAREEAARIRAEIDALIGEVRSVDSA